MQISRDGQRKLLESVKVETCVIRDRNNTIKSRKELNKQLQEDALQARKPNQYVIE